MTKPVAIPAFPARDDDAHKGVVGRIVVIGGRFDDVGMVGAPALSANAALRAGAGLVQILTTREAMQPVSILAPCATTRVMHEGDESRLASLARDFGADVVAVGPGLCPRVTGEHVLTLMEEFDGGMVVDADALNALASLGTWGAAPKRRIVLTPHAGEMKRLLAGMGMENVLPRVATRGLGVEDRSTIAQGLATKTGTIVVLKGAGTVVTDGTRTYVNDTGHSGMATGGAGDVLTGTIAALIGQKMDAFDAAVLGVYLHGRAGEIAADELGDISVTASDIAEAIAEAVFEHVDPATGE